jgi:hypothetical protein
MIWKFIFVTQVLDTLHLHQIEYNKLKNVFQHHADWIWKFKRNELDFAWHQNKMSNFPIAHQ